MDSTWSDAICAHSMDFSFYPGSATFPGIDVFPNVSLVENNFDAQEDAISNDDTICMSTSSGVCFDSDLNPVESDEAEATHMKPFKEFELENGESILCPEPLERTNSNLQIPAGTEEPSKDIFLDNIFEAALMGGSISCSRNKVKTAVPRDCCRGAQRESENEEICTPAQCTENGPRRGTKMSRKPEQHESCGTFGPSTSQGLNDDRLAQRDCSTVQGKKWKSSSSKPMQQKAEGKRAVKRTKRDRQVFCISDGSVDDDYMMRPWHCELCPSRFNIKGHLSQHVRYVHQKYRPHLCDICESAFGTRFARTQHVWTVHERKKPFACSVEGCSSRFGQRSHLNRHMKQHVSKK